ncbi:Bax inhibitor-1/YccA family protein [Catellatospora citrea]|uniref:Membrane protein n=1 Tax=Catellatospora citrea TaxID=53366 RepID=A0A8J3KFH4_9ACTN|nr:Bax inhibitor-1/YccA family protein [Catellatospora citrea]RKE12541.1 putative YccA/Bax inhibitor family protein [Catellatospora citrea]GIF96225.1 membrane protein [Catellatospora citrea]
MKSSNPVLGRITAAAQQPTYSVPGGQPYSYGGQTYQQPAGYGYPETVQSTRDVMTIDDVVVKTVSLIGAAVAAAAATWILVPTQALAVTWIAAMLVGLVLGLVISFAQITNPVILFAYALVEGVFLGAVSKAFETRWNGIVLQAVIATLGVFFIMAALYRARIIRATPKFMKVVIGAAAGLAVVMLVNFGISLFTGSAGPLRDGGGIAIIFSLICIVVAALMFVISFQQIEDGIAAGLPRKYGWLGAFGILVELVWLYLEILRLISYFQED